MGIRCPKCGSENVQFYTESKYHGPSLLNGCCGSVILGPVGILCSLCGQHTETKDYWVCKNCGNKFTTSDSDRVIVENEYMINKNQDMLNTYNDKIRKIEQWEQESGDINELEKQVLDAKQLYELNAKYITEYEVDMERRYPKIKIYRYIRNSIWVLMGVNILISIILITDDILFAIGFGLFSIFIFAKADDIFEKARYKIASENSQRLDAMKAENERLKNEYERLNTLMQDVRTKESIYNDSAKIRADVKRRKEIIDKDSNKQI